MNFRKHLYFSIVGLRGQRLGSIYEQYVQEDRQGIEPDTTKKHLVKMLDHCKQSVPYYQKLMAGMGDGYRNKPEDALCDMPILTKETIRENFNKLKSKDLATRKWYKNSSSGSTGEPVELIQDWDYASHAGAVKLLFSRLAGREIGELEVQIWGSIRDITRGSEKFQARFMNGIANTHLINAFRMTPDQIRDTILLINKRKPKLIVSYCENLLQIARFSRENNLPIEPQAAVLSTAGTLYPKMREKIEKAFGCKVYNRYGSREVGDVASSRDDCNGLWIAPWGNYIEIVDDNGNRVPDGVEGSILVTSLNNYAMPLIRYKIGDRGILAPKKANPKMNSQVFQEITGRTTDMIRLSNGNIVHAGFMVGLLYHKDWVAQMQVAQKSRDCVEYRIVRANNNYTQEELEAILADGRKVLGEGCHLDIKFVDEIPLTSSGKFRYMLSEIPDIENDRV